MGAPPGAQTMAGKGDHLARGSGGAGPAGPAGPAGAGGGAAAPCADAPLSPTAKFTCMQYACLGLCDKGLKFLKTSCPATCGYCKGGAGSELAARREAPPTPRGSQGESGRAAAINGTHVRLTWRRAPRGRRGHAQRTKFGKKPRRSAWAPQHRSEHSPRSLTRRFVAVPVEAVVVVARHVRLARPCGDLAPAERRFYGSTVGRIFLDGRHGLISCKCPL